MSNILKTKFGYLSIIEKDNHITRVYFSKVLAQLEGVGEENELVNKAKEQLSLFFEGRLTEFDLPLNFCEGSEFQQKVWKAISKINYGQVLSYKDICAQAEVGKAYQAVGSACGANPIPFIIPCHRVLASSGLGGYAFGAELKEELLKLEGII